MNILIVEDEEDVCLAMVERLRELRGRAKDNIYHTFSAIPALEILRRHPIDLLITDMMMPGMSGRELADENLIKAG